MANLTNLNNKFLVTTGGNVGIGNTSPTLSTLTVGIGSTNSPSQICQLAGSGSGVYSVLSLTNTNGTAADNNGVGLDFHVNAAYSATGRIQLIHPTAQSGTTTNSSMQFLTYGTVSGVTTFSPRMTIDYRGNVGIGTASPSTKLHIEGASAGYLQTIKNTTAGGDYLQMLAETGDAVFQFESGGTGGEATLNMYRDGTQYVKISADAGINNYFNNGANVGIGTTSPLNKFVVAEGTGQHGIELAPGTLSYIQAYDRATSDYGDLKIDAETIQFGTNNGSERMRITADGKVGIGTTSPQKNLQIFQTEGGVGAKHATIRLGGYLTVGPDIAAYRVTGNSNDQGLIFSTYDATNGTVDTMTLTNAGNVGIGTTTPYAFDTTATKFHVKNAGAGSGSVGEVARFEGSSDADGSGGTIRLGTSNDRGIYFEGGRTGSVPYGIIGTTEYNGAKTYSIYLQNTGNVGIGTESPSQLLHVSSSTNNPTGIGLQNSERYYSVRSNNFSLVFTDETVGSERMRIDSSGNIGIGTTAPNQTGYSTDSKVVTVKAPVSGGASALELIGLANADGNLAGAVNFMSYAETAPLAQITGVRHTADTAGKLYFKTSGNTVLSMLQDQTAYFYNTLYFSSSGVGSISWGSMAGGTGFGIRGESGRGLSLGSNGAWDKMIIDTSGNVGIGTTTPYARLNSYGAIISQSADNDPEVTLTNTGGFGVQSGGTIRVMQGFSRSGIAGDQIIFTYAATSWKSWSLDYTFASTQGVTQGIIGGYWNNSGGQTNVENIDSLQASAVVTHSGQSNIITFTFNAPGTHIFCSFVYTQSGGDGAPRGDRVTIETIANIP